MKQIKKLLALVLALAICAAFAIPAMASEDGTATSPDTTTEGKYTLTMNNAQEGHKYVIYQLLTGTVLPGGTNIPTGTLGDVEWGNSGYKAQDTNGQEMTASEYAKKLSEMTSAQLDTEIENIRGSFGNSFTDTPNAVDGTITWNNLPGGYYVVIDITDDADITGTDSRSNVMVQVVGDTTITPKPEILIPDKSVKEAQEAVDAEYKKIMDSEVGKTLDYKVTATVSVGTMNLNEKYFVKLTDTMSKGHTYVENSAKLVIKDNEGNVISDLSSMPGIDVFEPDDEQKIIVKVNSFDIKALLGEKMPSIGNVVVELTYQAIVNEDAIELDYVNNTAIWDYSHDGEDWQEGTPIETKVYVYDLNGEKVDGENAPLKGAEFKLYTENDEEIQVYQDEQGRYFVWNNKETLPEDYKPVSAIVANEGDTENKFTVHGLAAGKYVLKETKTPDGYNTMEDLTITITAVLDDDDNPTGECTYEYGDQTGSTLVTVVNNKGSVLPSTGGMGTTIIYIVGAVLVVGAGVLLFTKKRMHG
ncbi:SpaH/EbpB family LPXTG-anchored major pilin [Acutalibacter sp. 1XD8-36]|uniref:SpaH/EbpB family LPXTG-anchored major pilin n=1 Tax=Acutalibacter sp. 1XD8-36 TaxID=2320852 RepID=UPI00141363A4|nr:SpaH/EbpB family LPXTG-anchored major pilin [Acutalibacter sp. 1XD8-36]NBJ88249.1 isopeptide-forming domain-containing fimbrial protein [Acutalibacter sp. 1XD8-36]